MSLPAPCPTHRYKLRRRPISHALGAFIRWLARTRYFWYGALLGAGISVLATVDLLELAQQERDVAVRAAAQIRDWHATNWARATIEGAPETVSNIANQISLAVRP